MEASGFKRFVLNTVEKWTYAWATHVYPNSHGLYDFILSERFTRPYKLKVLGNGSSNGIDLSYFDPNLFPKQSNLLCKEQLGIPETNTVFLFVGRVVKDKGITELIDAFIRLHKEHNSCTLLLVGPLEAELDPLPMQTSRYIENHPNIVSVGYQQDVRPYFAISDLLVFPSYREGFPNVVLQANAMRLPAIVTNINGCNEIITHGYNGIIIPVKDTDSVYHAMKKLKNDKVLYDQLTLHARNEIVEKYDRNEIRNALLTEYRALQAKL